MMKIKKTGDLFEAEYTGSDNKVVKTEPMDRKSLLIALVKAGKHQVDVFDAIETCSKSSSPATKTPDYG